MNSTINNFNQENGHGSDSDTNSGDEAAAAEYYQPISGVDDGSGESDGENGINGVAENGIWSLDQNDVVYEEEEEEEEERNRREEIRRAFSEDENRRNAPLSEENATRVMEAMRGVSFGGVAPDWADRVPEDRWIDQLRRLRLSPNT
ncbi:uncharacterized protein LOC130939896 [Arachis stenosperma]|uniref:uncharacterized protein LOC130939896 n=1 Tax=Arachis stenosperma TaxID=217475 RepID=UPI0025ABD32B|nr:uncharacterized protein LOC130939896 [Arachis stenosperma]